MDVSADAVCKLHDLHRKLAELREKLERGPRLIKVREGNLIKLHTAMDECKAKTTTARMAADQKQLQLKSGEAKILELKSKLNACGTNREYQALLEQIAADEMTNSVLEDEILEALEKIENLQTTIAEAEGNVNAGQANLEQAKAKVATTAATLRADIQRMEAELAETEKQLPEQFRIEYERVVSAKGEDSMAPVEGDCCSGCYQQITPNLLNQLYMSQVVYCTVCGRMLYLPKEPSTG